MGFHSGVIEVSILPGYCDVSVGDWAPIIRCRGAIPLKTSRNCMIFIPDISVYVARIVKYREPGLLNIAREDEEKKRKASIILGKLTL